MVLMEDLKEYIGEFNARFPILDVKQDFYILNDYLMSGDADIYYSLIRLLKPNLIVEIGCGFSTILAHKALEKNGEGTVVGIEPYPRQKLVDYASKHNIELIQDKVQNVDSEVFGRLTENDILFIDSSHVYAPGSDVEFIIDDLLPKLPKGIYIHFHDINLPKPYSYYYGPTNNWNEQEYVAKLLESDKYSVVWFGSKESEDENKMKSLFPSYGKMKQKYPKAISSSLWLKFNGESE